MSYDSKRVYAIMVESTTVVTIRLREEKRKTRCLFNHVWIEFKTELRCTWKLGFFAAIALIRGNFFSYLRDILRARIHVRDHFD